MCSYMRVFTVARLCNMVCSPKVTVLKSKEPQRLLIPKVTRFVTFGSVWQWCSWLCRALLVLTSVLESSCGWPCLLQRKRKLRQKNTRKHQSKGKHSQKSVYYLLAMKQMTIRGMVVTCTMALLFCWLSTILLWFILFIHGHEFICFNLINN